MVKINQKKRAFILEPLFKMALERARQDSHPIESIDTRLAYCIRLLAGKNPIPASPREIAQGLLNMAQKLGRFQGVTENIIPHEVTTWPALEMLARDLIKTNVEQGIRCLELATLYQIRYWTQSPSRFHDTTEEKAHYVESLTSLLGKLNLLDVDFQQFDNWYFKNRF